MGGPTKRASRQANRWGMAGKPSFLRAMLEKVPIGTFSAICYGSGVVLPTEEILSLGPAEG